MRTAHENHLKAILTATKEKPCTIDYDFLDMVKEEDVCIYNLIQTAINDKICIVLPAGFKLTAEV